MQFLTCKGAVAVRLITPYCSSYNTFSMAKYNI